MSPRVLHRLPRRSTRPGTTVGGALNTAAKRWGLALVRYRLSSFEDNPEYEAQGAVMPERLPDARRIGRQMGLVLAPDKALSWTPKDLPLSWTPKDLP